MEHDDSKIDAKLDEIERFTRAVRHFSNEKIATVAVPHFHKLADDLIFSTNVEKGLKKYKDISSTGVNRINTALEKYYESEKV